MKQPESALRVARGQAGLITTAQCARLGISELRIANLVRSGLWHRLVRGVYDCGEPAVGDLHDHQRRRAAWLGLLGAGPDAIAVGVCALALHGVWGLPARIAPEVSLPGARGNRGPASIRVRRFDHGFGVATLRGRAVADLRSALVQALPEMNRETAVAVLDSTLFRRQLDAEGLADVRRRVRGRRGAARLTPWWDLVDGRAESPLETRARLVCVDACLPPDDIQVVVTDSRGAFIARGDMGWLREDGSWVLVEIDGVAIHSAPEALFRDRVRQNALASRTDTVILRFTAADVYQPTLIPRQVAAALGRVRGSPGPS
ncbi:type IV toxin-antitoxin system AbiEi family antitoxin domain-containing protein [Occultella aeris]|uniref:AbiEi antitoxin N-terminal domain-containing protein n=1 Tax=Occultella aeris TaxID=2761496 RepID=A0A7M4DDS5_9MICO|nr:type IV toxin-antitoxin system AbiEi family antitoxin domain-containing protein [Occultella aeris]VZO34996.1 hypothetical protein HALOF300_00264 [Occultella aeris]